MVSSVGSTPGSESDSMHGNDTKVKAVILEVLAVVDLLEVEVIVG